MQVWIQILSSLYVMELCIDESWTKRLANIVDDFDVVGKATYCVIVGFWLEERNQLKLFVKVLTSLGQVDSVILQVDHLYVEVLF